MSSLFATRTFQLNDASTERHDTKAGPGLVDKIRGSTEVAVGKVMKNQETAERAQERPRQIHTLPVLDVFVWA
ncbi:hypothetical protein AAF712_003063 [Marasmius tenuissimus]|uniref:Uncharacterized protein n=1 Tax=Marasmius tenuissimus TaxID=585030 RepID=A0ABR3A7Z0_9AGAR